MFHYYYDDPDFGYSPTIHQQLERQYYIREREYERRARALAAQKREAERRRREEYALQMRMRAVELQRRQRLIQEQYARKKLEEAEMRRRAMQMQEGTKPKEALVYGRDGRLYRYAYYPEFYEDESDAEIEQEELERQEEMHERETDVRPLEIPVMMEEIDETGKNVDVHTTPNSGNAQNIISIPVQSSGVEVEYASDDEQDSVSRSSLTPSEEKGESWLEPVASYFGPQ